MGIGKRLATAVVLCVVLLVSFASLASADIISPQVTLTYDSSSWTYTYHVVVPQGNTYPFGQLLIYTQATSLVGNQETWTIKAPSSGGETLDWQFGCTPAGSVDTIEWRAMSVEDEVMYGRWEGDFIVIAPYTTPVAGQGMTKDGVPSEHFFNIEVPGVPEPSSFLALSSMAGAACLFFRRRR